MRPISRHLPPIQPGFSPGLHRHILAIVLIALAVWTYFQPWEGLVATIFIFLCWLGAYESERKTRKLANKRRDTICDFRKAFDVRRVDPHIIRATHQEVGEYLGSKSSFPLRASDHFEHDLKIDGEDLDDIACAIAERLRYDMSNCRLNPLYGKVQTVRDLVMFFTHPSKAMG